MSSTPTSRAASESMLPLHTTSTFKSSTFIDPASGSKASSSTDQMHQVDFQFLNFSHPAQAKALGARKAVRSHVTKQQHQREHAAAAARRAKSFPPPENQLNIDLSPITRQHAATFPTNRPALHVPSPSSQYAVSWDATSRSPSPLTSPSYVTSPRLDLSTIYPEAWQPYLGVVVVSFSLHGFDGES